MIGPMEQPVTLFKALADETRLQILALLLTAGELCVCDLIAVLQLPQSTVSRHLAYLRKSGWVSDRRCGPWMYYSLAPAKDGFHNSLTALLREQLATLPATRAAVARLAACAPGSSCT